MLPTPADDLGEHLAATLNATSAALVAGAVVETAALSASGGDHAARVFVQRSFASNAYGDVAYYTGYALPAIAAPALWLTGYVAGDQDIARAGSAAVQALATTVVLTTTLKIATGRPYPLNGGDPNAPDRLDHPDFAQVWKPFTLGGRTAWPSGHTSATFSIAAAISGYYGGYVAPLVTYPIALAIGAGMLSGDRHWLSDVLAGALIAEAIGYPIGRSWRASQLARGRDASTSGARAPLRLMPMAGALGLQLSGALE